LAEGGIGMGLGMLIPGILSGLHCGGQDPAAGPEAGDVCPECGLSAIRQARFCPHCGHQLLVLRQCGICGKNLSAKTRFCPACGTPAGRTMEPRTCGECGASNRP